jgi:hypothetical protein
MLIVPGNEAYANLRNGIKKRTFRYPMKSEPGFSNGRLLPKTDPQFFLQPGEKVFTVGSCFAREIEHRLEVLQFNVPVARFTLPEGEFDHAPAHMLNEYNSGTILQRFESVFGGFEYGDEMGIEKTPDGYLDLFLHIHQKPVSLERLLERRREIAGLYSELESSDAVIITLGLTESWFDSEMGCYLNKAPSRSHISACPGRFYFHRMDAEDLLPRISKVIEMVNAHSNKKILLTVSPVPIEATFTTQDAIIANFYSKSTLRVVAQVIAEKYGNVEYFPSYEIAMSGGTGSFAHDNIHVTDNTVNAIMSVLVDNYVLRYQPETIDQQHNYVDCEVEERMGS